MKIVISSGHGLYVRGASGYLDEVDEARKVVDRVAEMLRLAAVDTKVFHDNTSKSQDQNLATIVNYHNAQTRDLDVSVHFNAYSKTSKPMGTECWYVTQATMAAEVSEAMADAGAFINRGAKKSTQLYFLNKTEMPSILLEVCFVDSSTDAELYRQHFESICEGIAEAIGNVQIDEEKPPVPEEPPAPGEPGVVLINCVARGNAAIIVNDRTITVGDDPDTPNRLVFTAALEGEIRVVINGEAYHNVEAGKPSSVPENQRDIITTVFGGAADPNNSAYAPYEYIDDDVLGVALPYKFPGARPRIKVTNTANDQSVVCEVVDLGPWLTDDEDYVMGDHRPLAEKCWEEGTPLPRGPNAGKVPNGAGIDLTPGAAKAIGISGKGVVDWQMLEE